MNVTSSADCDPLTTPVPNPVQNAPDSFSETKVTVALQGHKKQCQPEAVAGAFSAKSPAQYVVCESDQEKLRPKPQHERTPIGRQALFWELSHITRFP